MTRVLFVCTGNVHRSVLAERLLAARLPSGEAVRPESAGTEARPRPAWRGRPGRFWRSWAGTARLRGRRLTAPLVAGAGLVLGLAREHREAAVRLAPSAMRRCFTLKEFVRLAAGEWTGCGLDGRGDGARAAPARGRRGAGRDPGTVRAGRPARRGSVPGGPRSSAPGTLHGVAAPVLAFDGVVAAAATRGARPVRSRPPPTTSSTPGRSPTRCCTSAPGRSTGGEQAGVASGGRWRKRLTSLGQRLDLRCFPGCRAASDKS
ncbi:hypothetical protein E4K10_22335 [Streptomyces sp. T1317-0309]|nr:hypothetical protein E4K10_22335 [Streptomyces sp. T1317-0309]